MAKSLYDMLNESGGYADYQNNNYAAGSAPQYNGDLQNFLQQYQQVQQANQALNQGSAYARQGESPRYREMTQAERFVKGAQELTDFLASAGGNALFGEPGEGENPYEIKLENAPRFFANLPGMVLSSIPDLVGTFGENFVNAPVEEADSSTGLIEDRPLTGEEQLANIGYGALGLAGFIPGAGIEAKAAGLAGKGLGAVGKAGAANALSKAGSAAIKGNRAGVGMAERVAEAAGKSGKELNPYRWGDTAIEAAKSTAFEGGQEVGQTYFEEMRSGILGEDTPEHLVQAGFWGGLGGLVVGGGASAANTAIVNSRANRGLDRDGSPFNPLTAPMSSDEPWFSYFDNEEDFYNWDVSPEIKQQMLDAYADTRSNYVTGTSAKGITMRAGAPMLRYAPGIKSIRSSWNANEGGNGRAQWAKVFGLTEDEMSRVMALDDFHAAQELTVQSILQWNEGKPCWTILNRSPYTAPGSEMTMAIYGVTTGRAVGLPPGVSSEANGDFDGDLYGQLVLPADYAKLPTRNMISATAAVEKDGSVSHIGSALFDFESAGITATIGDSKVNKALREDVRSILEWHGVPIEDVDRYVNMIFQSFSKYDYKSDEDRSSKESQKWQNRLATALDHICAEINDKNGGFGSTAGDLVVEEIMSTMSKTGSLMFEAHEVVNAYGVNNGRAGKGLESTVDDIPVSRGKMPLGATAVTQIMIYYGRVKMALSKSESPMFRFKQMGAWQAKAVRALVDFGNEIAKVARVDDVEATVRWAMQMVNEYNLPIDYIDAVMKARTVAEIVERTGLGEKGSRFTASGKGLKYDDLKRIVTEVWNKNSDEYDAALGEYLTTDGEKPIDFSQHKIKIDGEHGDQSFARVFRKLFGSLKLSDLAETDRTETLDEYVESYSRNALNFNRNTFSQIPGFDELVNACVDDFEGESAAQAGSAIDCVYEAANTLKGDYVIDEATGYVESYKTDVHGKRQIDSEAQVELGIFVRLLNSIFGERMSMYLHIQGVEFFKHSKWARYFVNGTKEQMQRAMVAMGVTYHWAEVINVLKRNGSEDELKAALSRIDMSNPLNFMILDTMARDGWSDKALRRLTNPELLDFADIKKFFERYPEIGVRRDSSLIVYYALDDGYSVLGDSLGQKSRKAKSYLSQLENSTPQSVREQWHGIKNGFLEGDLVKRGIVVDALREAASMPYVVSTSAYAAALHDSAFFSTRAANKADSGRGSSLHAQAVAMLDDGFTTSFLEQLGFSVGSIPSAARYQVAFAIKQALFDSSFYERVFLYDDQSSYVDVSQDLLFAMVGREIDPDTGVTFADLDALIEGYPQVLQAILPRRIVPTSVGGETVTEVLDSLPGTYINNYIENSKNSSWVETRDISYIQNELMKDQRSSVLVLGGIGQDYGELIANPEAWAKRVDDELRQWSQAVYHLACIDDLAASAKISKYFADQSRTELRTVSNRLKILYDTIDNAMSVFKSSKEASREVAADGLVAKVLGYIDSESESVGSGENLASEKNMLLDQLDFLTDIIMSREELFFEIDKPWNGQLTDSDWALIKEKIRQKYKDKDNITQEQIDKEAIALVDKAYGESSQVDAAEFISPEDEASYDKMLDKIVEFVESGKYQRMPEEFDLSGVQEQLGELFRAKESGERLVSGDIHKIAVHFNREMFSAKVQDAYALTGHGVYSDPLSMMDRAQEYLQSAVDNIRAIKEGGGPLSLAVSDRSPNTFTLPHLDYSDPAVCWACDFAQIELESGLNPMSSGQNAGAYQWIGALDFISSEFHCPAPLRTGLSLQEAIELAKTQEAPLNFIEADTGHVRSVSVSELENGKYSEEEIANMSFAPQEDCCFPLCKHHNPRPISWNESRDFIAGRHTIASLLWYLSEKGVFKSKKKLGVFKNIAHVVKRSNELKRVMFTAGSREEVIENVRSYQEELAKFVYDVFCDSHMEGDFSKDDARVVAQMMTPLVEVTYKIGNNTNKETFSKWLLYDQADFDGIFDGIAQSENLENGFPQDAIVSYQVVPMSIIDVCKKLYRDVITGTSRFSQRQEQEFGPVDLQRIVTNSMRSWSGKNRGADGLANLISGMPVIRHRGDPGVLLGSSPNAMQSYLSIGGTTHRHAPRNGQEAIDQMKWLDPGQRVTLKNAQKNLGLPKSSPVIVVKSLRTPENLKSGTYVSGVEEQNLARVDGAINSLGDNIIIENAYNAVLFPRISDLENGDEVLRREWEDAKRKRRCLLILSDDVEDVRRVVGEKAWSRAYSEKGAEVEVAGKSYDLYAPSQYDIYDNGYEFPEMGISTFYNEEIALVFAGYGVFGEDNSGFLFNPDRANMKQFIEGNFVISRDALSGQYLSSFGENQDVIETGRRSARATALRRSPLLVADLASAEVRDDILDQLILATQGNERARFVFPSFDKSYSTQYDVIASSVLNFLIEVEHGNVTKQNLRSGKVEAGQCFGIVTANVNGLTYYMPLILRVGGTPYSLNKIYLDEHALGNGEVSIEFDAFLAPDEFEGIKVISPTIANKMYGSVMSREQAELLPHFGYNLEVLDSSGKKTPFDTLGIYSESAEKNRRIDSGLQVKTENLGTLSFIFPHHYFARRVKDGFVIDYDKFNCDRRTVDRLVQGDKAVWWDFVNGRFMLSDREEVNNAMVKVARICLTSGQDMNPIYAFSNIRLSKNDAARGLNGEIVYTGVVEQRRYNVLQAFSLLQYDELEYFFHALDPNFCFDGPADVNTANRKGVKPLIDHQGRILTKDGTYRTGHIYFLNQAEDSSMLGLPTGHIKRGSQAIINSGAIYGLKSSSEISDLVDFINMKGANTEAYMPGGKYVDRFAQAPATQEQADRISAMAREYDADVEFLPYAPGADRTFDWTDSAVDRRSKMFKESVHISQLEIVDDGKAVDLGGNSTAAQQVSGAIGRLKSALGINLSFTTIKIMFNETMCKTYNDGVGNKTVSVKHFVEWCDSIVSRVNNGKYLFDSAKTIDGRPIVGYVDSDILDILLTSKVVRDAVWLEDRPANVDPRSIYMQRMDKEAQATMEWLAIGSDNLAQREAVYTMLDYIGGTYGKPWLSRPLSDTGKHLSDAINNINPILRALGEDEDYPGLKAAQDRAKEIVSAAIEEDAKSKHRTVKYDKVDSGFLVHERTDPNSSKYGRVLNSAGVVAKFMALLNLNLPIGAIALRAKAQGLTKAYLIFQRALPDGVLFDRRGVELKDRRAVRESSRDKLVKKIWRTLYVLQWSGQDTLDLQQAKSVTELEALIDERMKNMTKEEKMLYKAYEFSSGGGALIEWQIENFFDAFAARANEENAPWWTEVVSADGQTRLEQFIYENPANFLVDVLTMKTGGQDIILAEQARQIVTRGEFASKSMTISALSKSFKNRPTGKFLFETGLCRFPQYTWNVGKWFLNHVAPVCTITAIARNMAVKIATSWKGREGVSGKFADYLNSLGVERMQTEQSIREAILYDTLMIGSTMVCGALFGLGAFEPPDDEYYDEYAGNPDEWTILGLRIADNWWLMDVLGPFAAVCATWKSIEIGKPRLDILQNWMDKAFYSNPVMKASDVARMLADPTEQYVEEFESVTDQYANAEGGSPDFMEMLLDDQVSFGTNWITQFFTPSFIREIGNSREFLQYERSYKKVVDKEGNEVYTDYLDSQIRKVSRKNPVLGVILNMANGALGFNESQTGYLATQMPKVKILDENQRGSLNYYNLYDDEGNELPEEYKQALGFEILAKLSSTNDIKSLVQDGFVIPYETRIYVSQMLNDWRQYEQDQYNAWVQETGKDAYTVGLGDWTDGMRLINEIDSAFYADLKFIKNLYNKLWDDELTSALQYYWREATTYERTKSGEYYATGQRRSIIPSPFLTAPGTYESPLFGTNADGTMGRGGNWETESAVIPGTSAGGRALVPIPAEVTKRRNLEDFADENNGGYSDTASGRALAEEAGTAKKKTTTPTSSNATGTKSGGYGRSGGSGGSGGGGGGGRSYVPNTYGPSTSISKANPSRIMNTDRVVKPDEEYLRPNFETKGSREAYKRSDI